MNKRKKYLLKIKTFIKAHKWEVILVLIFLFHLFLRFYQLESKNPFGYDQVNYAWAAKNSIVDHA